MHDHTAHHTAQAALITHRLDEANLAAKQALDRVTDLALAGIYHSVLAHTPEACDVVLEPSERGPYMSIHSIGRDLDDDGGSDAWAALGGDHTDALQDLAADLGESDTRWHGEHVTAIGTNLYRISLVALAAHVQTLTNGDPR